MKNERKNTENFPNHHKCNSWTRKQGSLHLPALGNHRGVIAGTGGAFADEKRKQMTPIPDKILPPEPKEGDLFGPKEKEMMELTNALLRACIDGDTAEAVRLWWEIEKRTQDKK